MRRRAERQAEARQGWVEGLSFRPASIRQADRPPPSLGERVKESVDKACSRAGSALTKALPGCVLLWLLWSLWSRLGPCGYFRIVFRP